MRTADLTDAYLDYWAARAEGVPAADLEFRANGTLCVRNLRGSWGPTVVVQVLDYSTNWALTGPLRDKHNMWISDDGDGIVFASVIPHMNEAIQSGPTAMIAICRAVVRAAFGDEVEDLPCA